MTEKSAFQVTNKKQFLALLKDADLKKDKLQSISGELGARIKEAGDNGYLNRGAFGMMVRLYRMEEDKRADFLRSFDAYRAYADEEQLFGSEHVGDLVDAAQRDPESPDDEQRAVDEHIARNTEAIERGITPLPDGEPSASETKSADPFQEDAAAKKPSRRRKAAGVGEEGDAPGSYAITH